MLQNYGLQFGSAFPKGLLDVQKRLVVRRRSRCWKKPVRDVIVRQCNDCPICFWGIERCAVCNKMETQDTKRLYELGVCCDVGNGLCEIKYKEETKTRSARYCAPCVGKRIRATQVPGKIHWIGRQIFPENWPVSGQHQRLPPPA